MQGLGFELWAVLLGTAVGTQVPASTGGLQGPPSYLHPLAQLPEAPILPGWAPHSDSIPHPQLPFAVYFRALVNFTRSIDYSPQLEDAGSEEFREVSEAVVDTVR